MSTAARRRSRTPRICTNWLRRRVRCHRRCCEASTRGVCDERELPLCPSFRGLRHLSVTEVYVAISWTDPVSAECKACKRFHIRASSGPLWKPPLARKSCRRCQFREYLLGGGG